MAAREIVALNEATPQLEVPQAGDDYLAPRNVDIRNGTTSMALTVRNTWTDASNHESVELSFSTYSSAVYARVKPSTAGTGSDNIGLVLGTTGTGAIVAEMPDGTSTGGNARGQGATDLQHHSRTAAAQVASGTAAFAAGYRNTVSGEAAAGLGYQNTASGGASLTCGYLGTASGLYALTHGRECTASAESAWAMSTEAVANKVNQHAVGGGSFAAIGDCQYSTLIMAKATTDATPTELRIRDRDNTETRATIPASTTWAFTAHIMGRSASGTDNAYYVRQGILKRDASNNTAIVGSVGTVGTDIESDAAWDVAITADDTNEALAITVTGKAATNIRWVARVDLVEVGYA